MRLRYGAWSLRYGPAIVLGLLGAFLPVLIAVDAVRGGRPSEAFDISAIGCCSLVLWGGAAVSLAIGHPIGARLDGTTVTVRRAFSTAYADLAATPRVWLEPVAVDCKPSRYAPREHYVVARLCLLDTGGDVLRLPLAAADWEMPADQRAALAAAIESGVRDPARASVAATVRHGPVRHRV